MIIGKIWLNGFDVLSKKIKKPIIITSWNIKVNNLSLIDLLFNCGPESIEIILSGNITLENPDASPRMLMIGMHWDDRSWLPGFHPRWFYRYPKTFPDIQPASLSLAMFLPVEPLVLTPWP